MYVMFLWTTVIQNMHTVRAEVITKLILGGTGPVIFQQTSLLE